MQAPRSSTCLTKERRSEKSDFPQGFLPAYGSGLAFKGTAANGALEFYGITDRGPNGDGPNAPAGRERHHRQQDVPVGELPPVDRHDRARQGRRGAESSPRSALEQVKANGLPPPGAVGNSAEIPLGDTCIQPRRPASAPTAWTPRHRGRQGAQRAVGLRRVRPLHPADRHRHRHDPRSTSPARARPTCRRAGAAPAQPRHGRAGARHRQRQAARLPAEPAQRRQASRSVTARSNTSCASRSSRAGSSSTRPPRPRRCTPTRSTAPVRQGPHRQRQARRHGEPGQRQFIVIEQGTAPSGKVANR